MIPVLFYNFLIYKQYFGFFTAGAGRKRREKSARWDIRRRIQEKLLYKNDRYGNIFQRIQGHNGVPPDEAATSSGKDGNTATTRYRQASAIHTCIIIGQFASNYNDFMWKSGAGLGLRCCITARCMVWTHTGTLFLISHRGGRPAFWPSRFSPCEKSEFERTAAVVSLRFSFLFLRIGGICRAEVSDSQVSTLHRPGEPKRVPGTILRRRKRT